MARTAPTKLFFLCLLAGLLGPFAARAQLQGVSLPEAPQKESARARLHSGRMAADTVLQLPFWDDFSGSRSVPDTNRWQKGPEVAITNSIAVLPPSYNVATFDGLQASGRPYSQDPNLSGPADSLLSLTIHTGPEELLPEEQSGVYFSFYWQLQGRGNRPDAGDSLLLYFMDADSSWQQVWAESGRQEIDSAAFQQELIGLQQAGEQANASFFHENFRFLFVSYNRQSGQYDLWHVDYIFLDRNRSSSNLYYQDRAISELPPSLFRGYTALPIAQYFAAPETYTNPDFSFSVFSLERPGKEEAVEYNVATLTPAGDTLIQARKALIQDEFGNLLKGQQHFGINGPGIGPEELLPYSDADSLYLNTYVFLTSEEGREFFNHNDTARIVNVLHDYFAYDDGTAEYGMEVRGQGTRVAYEFRLESRDTLTHIDLYLPYFSQGLGDQRVDLKVWKRLNLNGESTDSLLYTQRDVPLNNSPGLNEFNSYPLHLPQVLEPGTFYIGFEKRSDRFLALGFDRNTNSQEKVFVSTDASSWFAGQEADAGSLMMRPRFRQGVDPTVLSSREPIIDYPVRIFPNPSEGSFRVASEARRILVYNQQGQLLRSYEQPAGNRETAVNLQGQAAGLYIVKLIFRDGTLTRKVVVR